MDATVEKTGSSSASSSQTTSVVPEAVTDGGGEDEQVERFYALLANVRAQRAVYGGEGHGGAARKRARGGGELPWKPKFRMEDFEEDGAAGRCGWKKERRDGAVEPQRPEKHVPGEEINDGEIVKDSGLRVAPR